MDLHDLKYFETIAELGHLGRAAKQLCRSAPALTKCIRRLERAFGAELFARAGRGIRLTAAGEVLLERARLLRIDLADTIRAMDDVSGGVAGHVRVGVAPTMAQYLLPAACRVFLAEAKEVTIETVIGMYPVLQDSLKSGQIDFAITALPTIDEFISHPIMEDEVVVVAGSSHELFRKRARIQDLLAYRWVLPAASLEAETRQWLERAFEFRGLPKPSVQIETNSITLLPRLIAQTDLLSFISRRNLGSGRVGAPLKEVRLKATTMHREFGVIYRKDCYLSPVARRFITLLCTKGGSLFSDQTEVVKTKIAVRRPRDPIAPAKKSANRVNALRLRS
jgi:DNA-binding transcriptional LysR family regulator